MVERYLIMINFIWQLIKIGIGILLILGLSYILRILILIYKASKKESNKSICDDCENLIRKEKFSGGGYKYICRKMDYNLYEPPEICFWHQKKSGD